jgi:hypothetical protein
MAGEKKALWLRAKGAAAEVIGVVVGGGRGGRGETMAKGEGGRPLKRPFCIECLYAAEQWPLCLEVAGQVIGIA